MTDLLTTSEVAAMLGITSRGVLFAVERGELTALWEQHGKSRRARFRRADIEDYLRRNREPSIESEAV